MGVGVAVGTGVGDRVGVGVGSGVGVGVGVRAGLGIGVGVGVRVGPGSGWAQDESSPTPMSTMVSQRIRMGSMLLTVVAASNWWGVVGSDGPIGRRSDPRAAGIHAGRLATACLGDESDRSWTRGRSGSQAPSLFAEPGAAPNRWSRLPRPCRLRADCELQRARPRAPRSGVGLQGTIRRTRSPSVIVRACCAIASSKSSRSPSGGSTWVNRGAAQDQT